jgi:hypothetical protein
LNRRIGINSIINKFKLVNINVFESDMGGILVESVSVEVVTVDVVTVDVVCSNILRSPYSAINSDFS